MSELQDKRIVLGVSGGVAAYKTCELARRLVKAGATVDVVMTEAATHFVGAQTFQALTGRPVHVSLWDDRFDNGMGHIDLSRGAAAILIAPATANCIARLAQGFADDLLTTLCLARECPLLIAPAMNRQMWDAVPTQRNVAQLRADGVTLLGPASGEQACGEVGEGRMWEAAELFDALLAFFQPKLLAGKRVLLTLGPTFEALDPVRGLTNSSSGRMGMALARACAEVGADVTAVCGPISLATPAGVTRIEVLSALQMRDAVLAQLGQLGQPSEQRAGQQTEQQSTDIFIAVAAVADYRPVTSATHKLKKSGQTLTLELTPNPDILAEVAALADAPFCVGFAAESRDLAAYAEGKRLAKRLPLVVGNLVQDGLGGAHNSVTLFDTAGAHPLPPGDKLTVARAIVRHMAKMVEMMNDPTPH